MNKTREIEMSKMMNVEMQNSHRLVYCHMIQRKICQEPNSLCPIYRYIRPDVIILTTELLKRTLYLQNFMKFKSNTAGFTIYKQKGEEYLTQLNTKHRVSVT